MQIKKVLAVIEEYNVLAPLLVIQILAQKSKSLQLSVVRGKIYIKNILLLPLHL